MAFHRNTYIRVALAAFLAGVMLMCTACGTGEAVETSPAPGEVEQVQPDMALSKRPEPPEMIGPIPEGGDQAPKEEGFSFADVVNTEFYFSSGAGGWRTVLYIHEDGSFEGQYLDSDMGDQGEGYPNGTCYYSAFSGQFTQPERVNDTTYRMRVSGLAYEKPLDEEEIVDDIRWCYIDAYGISGAEDVYLYLPGTPLAELPEAYRGWVGYYDLSQTEETELPFYGLYNEAEENGFSSYPVPDAAELLQAEINGAEIVAEELEKSLQEAMNQADMNIAAANLYQVWDDTLNIAWRFLKAELEPEVMERLTAEQLDWIAEKEAAAAAIAEEYQGGSIQGMLIGMETAELTRQRVYVLAEYLN